MVVDYRGSFFRQGEGEGPASLGASAFFLRMSERKIKAYMEVTAGIQLGVGLAKFYKRWNWTALDGAEMSQEDLLRFHEIAREAYEYAIQLQNPGFVKWVNTEWRWSEEGDRHSWL